MIMTEIRLKNIAIHGSLIDMCARLRIQFDNEINYETEIKSESTREQVAEHLINLGALILKETKE